MGSGSARPFSGRRNELALILAGLTRARGGQSTTVAVIGEPGIGKTRLASEAATVASSSGFAVLWGRAWEAGGAPAYWLWRQVCEDLPRDSIAQLWGARGAAAADPEQARFELFDAVTRAITARARACPLMCILDDLHVADVPSLELVAFVTHHLRASPVIWLVTWRDAEGSRVPARDHLARIAREATVVPLAALSESESNLLIDHVRADADVQLRNRLVTATGGNPLFLLETLAALATGRAPPSDQLPLAQGIASIVRDRIAPLQPKTRAIADAASVVGRDVTLARWTEAAGEPPEAVRRAARELVDAGVINEHATDRWRFGHDLVREAIYRDADHRLIHERLARALHRDVAAGDVSVIGERAHHALLALGTGDDPHDALAWAVEASEHARRQCAFEEAIAIADRALQIGPAAQRDPALQLARGRAYLDRNDTARAIEAFSSTIALARKADDPRMLAAAVLGLGSRYVLGDHLHDLIALIDETMALLPATERELQARLLARKAAALTPALDTDAALDMAREAIALVEDSPDVAARLEVAVAAGAAFAAMGPPRESAAIDERVVALARIQNDRALELRGLSRLVIDHIQLGDFARADALLPARDALARSLIQPRFQWMEPLFRSLRASLRGDFARCDVEIDQALAYAESDPNCRRACAVHRAWMLLFADRIDDLRAHEPVVLEALRTMTPIISTAVRAAIRLRSGELAAARQEVDALESTFASGRAPMILATLAEVIAEVGPRELQRDLYDLLATHADTFAAYSLFGIVSGPHIASCLGNLAGALGDQERARAHFESALVATTRTGAIVARAWTHYWYGRTLARAGLPDATHHLDAAAHDAGVVGMDRLITRCRDAAGPGPRTSSRRPDIPQPALHWTLAERAGSWLVEIADRSFLVPNLRGMPLLARLAASPHVEIHSVELVSGSEADPGDAGELLDDKARSDYRKRLATLADELDEARARGDDVRAEAVRDEHDALVKELSRAVGLGGRVRRAGAASERARVTAQRRLREAIRKIAELDGELGGHLERAIRTGTFCAYRP